MKNKTTHDDDNAAFAMNIELACWLFAFAVTAVFAWLIF